MKSNTLLCLGFAFGSAFGSGACGSGIADPEKQVTIAEGIYGVTTYYDDVGNNSPQPKSLDFTITRRSDGTVAATVKSGADGFFERALAAGSYRLCTSFQRCTVVEVVAGARVRADYEMGPGPGWSRCDLPGGTVVDCR